MKNGLFFLCKLMLAFCLFFIVIKDVEQYINYRLNVQIYEQMAKKYGCTFISPTATTEEIGMFDCNEHITFKKLEN